MTVAGTIERFKGTLAKMGSEILYHREEGGVACPCRTPEGFRDPAWHEQNPDEPVCNEQGFLSAETTEFTFKGSVQPALTASTRPSQRASDLLGDVRRDDKIGIFPCEWGGSTIDLDGWSDAGEDYLEYAGARYLVAAADRLPDVDGSPSHHWEAGLRLLTGRRPS